MKIRSLGTIRWRCILSAPPNDTPGPPLRPEACEQLAKLGSGDVVQRARTSWVQLTKIDSKSYYIKTYVYPTAADRRRGWLRTTFAAPSRAAREAKALLWLRCHGFLAPRPLSVAEARRFGVLHAAVLITEAIDGAPLSVALPRLSAPARTSVLIALHAHVVALHRAGFRDRNLDLRNILLVGDADAPRFAKIDSPRHRLRRPGSRDDALTRGDWRRLTASLAELGLAWPSEVHRADTRRA